MRPHCTWLTNIPHTHMADCIALEPGTPALPQVLNTLFFVETRRIENPRNILQLLSMNTRRTKVVELSSGTHRCFGFHVSVVFGRGRQALPNCTTAGIASARLVASHTCSIIYGLETIASSGSNVTTPLASISGIP